MERKNLVRVSMTEKGKQAYEQSTKRKSIHKVMSVLSEQERQQLLASLEKLRNRALKEIRVEHKPDACQFFLYPFPTSNRIPP